MFFHKNWDHIAESPRFIYNTNYNYINKGNQFYMYPLWLKHRTVKFLFLSDCISKFIQRFSLKRAFAFYLSSILKNRFLKLYISNFNSIWNTIKSLLSNISLLKSKHKTFFVLRQLKQKNITLFLYVYYIKLLTYKWNRFVLFLDLFKKNNFVHYIYLYFFFRSDFFIKHFISSINAAFPILLNIKQSSNKYFKYISNQVKMVYLDSLFTVLNCYAHSFTLLFKSLNKYESLNHSFFNKIVFLLNRKKSTFYKSSFLILNKSYYLKTFLDNAFSTLYHYFYTTKLTNLKYNNLLGYFSFLNLKWKITFLTLLQNSFLTWNKVLTIWLHLQRSNFINFFKTWMLNRKNLVPFYRKKSVLTFVLKIVNNINNKLSRFDSFSTNPNWRFGKRDLYKVSKFSIYANYDVHRKSRLASNLFINTNYFQKKLMTILGKKKYKEIFLFRTNTKHSINYFLQMHYNMNIKTFSNFYNILKRKYTLNKVKDLFFFFEYKINVFFKKYLYDICLEKVILLKSNDSMDSLFIGDLIIRENQSFNFVKYYVFFNFIFFVDPLKLKCKFNVLSIIYNKIYDSFLSDFLSTDSVSHPFNRVSHFSFLNNCWFKLFNSLYYNKELLFLNNGKSYIKSFIYYNLKCNNNNNSLPLSSSSSYYYLNTNTISSKFISIYSLNKSYKQYNLVDYNYAFTSNLSKEHSYMKNDLVPFLNKKYHDISSKYKTKLSQFIGKRSKKLKKYYPLKNLKVPHYFKKRKLFMKKRHLSYRFFRRGKVSKKHLLRTKAPVWHSDRRYLDNKVVTWNHHRREPSFFVFKELSRYFSKKGSLNRLTKKTKLIPNQFNFLKK